MTAEIAILNRSAVALAADSAVTIGGERSRKIFNTVNKLFTLSKHFPVGVMICGSAEIMGVPWETIIKVYRKRLGNKGYAHLKNYVQDFLRFLSNNRQLFPASQQKAYFIGVVSALFRRINDEIQAKVKTAIDNKGSCSISEVRRIISSEIDHHFARLSKAKNLPGFNTKFAARLRRKFRKEVRELQTKVFQKLPVRAPDRRKLNVLVGLVFIRDQFNFSGTSGVVIAGFGQDDIFPSLKELIVEGVIESKLRFRAGRNVEIGWHSLNASLVPIAQSEVVQTFIGGMDPGLEGLLNKFLDTVFADYPSILLNHVPGLNGQQKQRR